MKISNPIAKMGENSATEFLLQKGFKILERNYRPKYAEIDIIAIDPIESILVFVEVKTRTSFIFGSPLEAINYFKLKNIFKAAQFYSMLNPKLPESLRIDAISVEIKNGIVVKIDHFENISG